MLPVPTRASTAASEAGSTRPLGWWLASLGTSLCADQVFFLALTWAAVQQGSPGQVGLVVAAASLPRLLILLFGGTLADRVNPRLLAAAADVGRALTVAGVAALVLSVELHIWQLVVVAVAVGALDGLFMPAIGAVPAQIAPAELMGRAGALRSVVQRVALLLAGPISGGMIAWAGTAAGFGTAALLFLCSVVFLLLLVRSRHQVPAPEAPEPEQPSTRRVPLTRDLVEGLRVVRQHPVLPWLLLLVAALNLGFAGPVTAGLPLLAAHQQWGASGAGALMGTFGLGAAVTGLTLVVVRHVPRAGAVLLAGLASMGLSIAAFALATDFTVALLVALVLGLSSGVVSSIVYGLVLSTSPVAALGRVMALVSLTLEGTFPVSNYLTGAVAGTHGTGIAFVGGGVLMVLAAAAAATRPRIMNLEAESGTGTAATATAEPQQSVVNA